MDHSRLRSLDIFRGLTVALMIIVNSPGNNNSFIWLEHANWHGCTLADLVFPFFILIAGASAVISLSRAQQKGLLPASLLYKVSKRTLVLFGLGVLLNAFPHFDFSSLRIMGVLQRIALCYFFSSLFYLTTSKNTQLVVLSALLIGYALLMFFFPVPGFGSGDLTKAGNAAAYLDGLLIPTAHLYHGGFDPEGLLTTLPAIATALLGNCLGYLLLSPRVKTKTTLYLLLSGLSLLGLGGFWSLFFPINKALWSSSYVLWTGGLAFVLFAVCYWLIEIRHSLYWTKPFEIFGLSALSAFILHVLFLKIQAVIIVPSYHAPTNLRIFITEHLFSFAPLKLASLLYALTYMLLWLLIIAYYRPLMPSRFDKRGMLEPDH